MGGLVSLGRQKKRTARLNSFDASSSSSSSLPSEPRVVKSMSFEEERYLASKSESRILDEKPKSSQEIIHLNKSDSSTRDFASEFASKAQGCGSFWNNFVYCLRVTVR